ncbi:MAG TPA: hypothetical protein ENH29_01100 [Bacteroidetes bacterium]|nr:hypothetical protein [Bacteroidota bacterium]
MNQYSQLKKIERNARFQVVPQTSHYENKKPNANKKIPERYFCLEPLVNMLRDPNPASRLFAIRQLQSWNNRFFVSKLRSFLHDSSEAVQIEARRKLKPVEMFYRKKFSFFQFKLKKEPDEPAYKLGFAITCLRYAQIWVEEEKLQEYFFRQAIKYLNQLIRVHEPKAKYFYYRGQTLLGMGQNRFAIEDFKKVLQFRPNHTGAMLTLIDQYLTLYALHKALPLIQQLQQKKLPASLTSVVNFWHTPQF